MTDMTPTELKALAQAVDYLWNDERKHYEAEPDEMHIFRAVESLKGYLNRHGLGHTIHGWVDSNGSICRPLWASADTELSGEG